MKLNHVRSVMLALPEVNEEPHFESTSFRIRGKIIATAPPGDEFLHIFVQEQEREPALAVYPEFIEKLLWGAKVAGLRISLANAKPAVVKQLLLQAWLHKAPKKLVTQFQNSTHTKDLTSSR